LLPSTLGFSAVACHNGCYPEGFGILLAAENKYIDSSMPYLSIEQLTMFCFFLFVCSLFAG
jgi:hypothetical protein